MKAWKYRTIYDEQNPVRIDYVQLDLFNCWENLPFRTSKSYTLREGEGGFAHKLEICSKIFLCRKHEEWTFLNTGYFLRNENLLSLVLHRNPSEY